MSLSKEREDQVWSKLRTIVDPDKEEDIVELGLISHLKLGDESVYFHFHLAEKDPQIRDQYQFFVEKAVKELKWVKMVTIIMAKAPEKSSLEASFQGVKQVKHIIAVSSCKGGVGKSSVAVNLATSLKLDGHSVGIFDADIYGPSLPTMLDLKAEIETGDDGLLIPRESHGMKCMSFGFVDAETSGNPAIMRGPMVTQVLNQLLTGTAWGELDYLILDLPPGTGDVQITLSQLLPLSGVVVLTTPQKLSVVDVEKGIQMFEKLNIPLLGLVENNQYFICENCDEKHFIYGKGALDSLSASHTWHFTRGLPMTKGMAECGDTGMPFVIRYPNDLLSKAFDLLALDVEMSLKAIEDDFSKAPELLFEPGKGMELLRFDEKGTHYSTAISAFDLRLKCQCAHCVNEFTGELQLEAEKIERDIEPLSLKPIGRYAIGVNWSDGHSSIFPLVFLQNL